ncbi:hypothetical protein [Pseudomonas fluorescens]|uniref:hypothetical protein n=1 Tax=Pseudomonas TaxID=286 RepID=UPI003CFF2147
MDGEALIDKRQWHGAITASTLDLGKAEAVEKNVASDALFGGNASGIKLTETDLFCRFDNQQGSH